jgi:hypothetical protein
VGVWYYRVSAIGPWGESLASETVMVYLAGGTIGIVWDPIPGATGYNVYRNIDPLGNGGEVRLMIAEVVDAYYEDDGLLTPAGDALTPLPKGSLSLWEALPVTLGTPREGLGAVVVGINSTSGTKQVLYAIGGRVNNSGLAGDYLATGEVAGIYPDGTLSVFSPLSYDMNVPRAFMALVSNLGQDMIIGPGGDPGEGPPPPVGGEAGDLMLFAMHGDEEYDFSKNDGRKDMEVCRIIKENGIIDPWTIQTYTVPQKSHGLGALLYFDFMFTFVGVKDEDLTSPPNMLDSSVTRMVYDENAVTDDIILPSGQSAGSSFVIPRVYYGMLRLNGYDFAIGGHNGTIPEATIERTVW